MGKIGLSVAAKGVVQQLEPSVRSAIQDGLPLRVVCPSLNGTETPHQIGLSHRNAQTAYAPRSARADKASNNYEERPRDKGLIEGRPFEQRPPSGPHSNLHLPSEATPYIL